MTVLKAYDDGTEAWQTIVVGRQGPAGVVQADLAITYDAPTQTVGSDGTIVPPEPDEQLDDGDVL
jgi:hypothetical protein